MPEVDGRNAGADQRHMVEIGPAEGDIDRVGNPLDDQAGGVADIGGAGNRQYQVGPVAHAPGRQCAAEIGASMRQALFRGDIVQTGETDHRVDEETLGRVSGPSPFALGDIVDECERQRQVADDIADAAPDGVGQDCSVYDSGRAQDYRIQRFVDREDQPVQRLKRIVEGGRLRLLAGARRERGCQGKQTGRHAYGRPDAHPPEQGRTLVYERLAGRVHDMLESFPHLRFSTLRHMAESG